MNLVEVKRISYYPPSKGFAVLLMEKDGGRHLQIMVDSYQAQAIALYFESVKMPRPMTHDILAHCIESLDGEINRVLISHIDNDTFFAQIEVYSPHCGDIIIDSRPSDAIAMALRMLVPIYVSDDVMSSVSSDKIISDSDSSVSSMSSKEISREISEDFVLDNLNEALDKAILDEEYELAAKLRDRIKQLEKKSIT